MEHTEEQTEEIEDLEECARSGRIPETGKRYRVRIDDERYVIADPVPTGRQLLDEAGKRPTEEHLLFQWQHGGMLEEIRPDETVDLRQPGIERFITFESAESYRLEIDGRVFEWGAPLITGLTLKTLADVDPDRYGIWLEVRGGEDRPIANDESVDISARGLERFFTGIVQTTEG